MGRFFKLVFRFLAALTVVLIAVYLMRGPLLARPLASLVADQLSSTLGGEFEIQRVEGNWFSRLRLIEMRTRQSPPEGPLTHIEFGRATVEYDLFKLLGSNPAEAIRHVSLDSARIAVDLTRHEPEPEEPEAVVELKELLQLLPEPLPDIDITGRVRIHTAGGLVDLRGIHLEEEGQQALRLRIARVTLPPMAAPIPEGRLDLLVRHEDRGRLHFRMDEPLAGIRVERAEVDDFDRFSAVVALDAGVIQVGLDGARFTTDTQGLDLTRLPPWLPRQLPAAFEWPKSGRVALDLDLLLNEPPEATVSLAVEDLEWREAIGQHIELEGEWSGERGQVRRLDARLATGTVSIEELAVDLRSPYLVTGAKALRVDVPDLAEVLGKLPLDADQRDRIAAMPRPVTVRVIAHEPEPRRLVFEEVRFEGGGSVVLFKGAALLPVDPEDWLETEPTLELAAELANPGLWADGLPEVTGRVQVKGTVRGDLRSPDASLTVDGKRLRVDGRPVERIDVDVALDWPALEVKSLALVADAGRVTAKGSADLEALTVGPSSFEVDVPDLAGLAALIPGAPAVRGAIKGTGTISWDGRLVQGGATLEGSGLGVEEQEIGELELRVSADGSLLVVQQARVDGPLLRVSTEAEIDLERREATVRALEAVAEGRAAKLTQPLSLSWSEGGFALADLALDALGGQVSGSLRRAGGDWQGSLTVRAVDLRQLAGELEGHLDCDLTAAGTRFEVVATVPEFAFEGHRGRLELKASQEQGGIRLDRLELQAGGALKATGTGQLPFRLDPDSGALVRLVEPVHPTRLSIQGEITDASLFVKKIVSGGLAFSIEADKEGLQASAELRKVVLDGGVELPSRTTLGLGGGADGLVMTVSSEPDGIGELNGTVRSDEPVVWTDPTTLKRAFEKGRVEGKVRINLPDLGFVSRLVTQVRHLEGAAQVDLELSGPLRSPEVVGSTTVSGVSATLGGLPPVQELAGTLRFTPRRLEFAPIKGEIGYEPFELTGTVELPDSGAPILDVALKGANLLLVRQRHLRVRADLDVTAKGPLDALSAAGVVTITDGLYSQPIDIFAGGGARVADTSMQFFSVRSGPMANATLDIKLLGDESFRIRNNFVRGSLSFDLALKGTGKVPEPRGSIFLQETLVALPATSLKIVQGEIRFPPDNPFAPSVEMAGRTRMRGFDLDLRVTGVAPELQVFLSSSPSLSQEDAYVLITTGGLPADYENEAGQRAALARAGSFVGKQFLSRLTGPSDPDKETVFDRIEVEVGRDVSRSGQETYEAEFRVRRPWFLRGERDRWDQYNFGVVWRIRFR